MSLIIRTANIDGEITAAEDAKIPVMDRGFLYGDSVYEVFRTYEGVPLFLDEHFQRLENSARLISMEITQTRQELINEIRRTVKASGAPGKEDCYVRYQITRGAGPIDLHPSADIKTRYVIIVAPVPNAKPEFYSSGMSMAIPGIRRNPVDSLDPNIKGGNYLNNILAITQARKLGCDDSVILDRDDFVTEAANSNVWFVIDDKLVTPGAGNLKGLTKKALHQALSTTDIASQERQIHVSELTAAGECFVTSATREVMPVKSLRLEEGDVVEFPHGGGTVTRRVAQVYKDYVAAHIDANRHLSLF